MWSLSIIPLPFISNPSRPVRHPRRCDTTSTTTPHTQVSIPVYRATGVLMLDSNSETQDYTQSVDSWSLRSLKYELLVRTHLFVSDALVSCYHFGKWPFPDDRLNELSPSNDDVGISSLKYIPAIHPEFHLAIMGALSYEWLIGQVCNKDSRHDHDGRIQNRDRSTVSSHKI